MSRASDLLAICVKYRSSWNKKFVVGNELSERQLQNARTAFNVPAAASLVAMVDSTVTGSGEVGLLVSDAGVHWVNPMFASTKARSPFQSWDDLATSTINRGGPPLWQEIVFSDGSAYSNASSLFSTSKLVELLKELQAAAKAFKERRDKEPVPDVYIVFEDDQESPEWTIGINRKTKSGLSAQAIRAYVEAGKINPASCLVWRHGMDEWVALSTVRELMPAKKPEPPPFPSGPTKVLPAPSPSPKKLATVDVNLCRLESLLPLPGMTRDRVLLIKKYRKERGPLLSLEEVARLCKMRPDEAANLNGLLGFSVRPSN